MKKNFNQWVKYYTRYQESREKIKFLTREEYLKSFPNSEIDKNIYMVEVRKTLAGNSKTILEQWMLKDFEQLYKIYLEK